MDSFNQVLLILHFLGLALGFSASFANLVMGGLIAKAPPAEKPVLGRFPPAMSRLADVGLTLLWVTGITLVYTKWTGFDVMPWQFHAKLTAVVLLTVTIGYIRVLQRRVRKGDQPAAARIPTMGKIGIVFGLTAVIFAVLTFD